MKKHIFHYSIAELVPYIDWSYFLHAWGLSPNTKGCSTADEVVRDANEMLNEMQERYSTHAIFALCDARGDGDNIIIEETLLPLLRQQHAIAGKPNLCLSDYVSPYGDKIGLFATTVDSAFGQEYINDDYMRILSSALADRLAEATATLMHRNVRSSKELWGYALGEKLSVEELNREEYQGIRPAIGYPSLPDQSIIFIIDKLLQLSDIGIKLTSNGAMSPHSSVSIYFPSTPQACDKYTPTATQVQHNSFAPPDDKGEQIFRNDILLRNAFILLYPCYIHPDSASQCRIL